MGGFLNVLKPEGITSHDAVLQVRRILGEKRVGHLGTLDPMAVGVLPMVLGRYTRLSEYLLDEDKEYLAEFAFGITTDTCDLDGRITSRVPCEGLAPPDIVRFLAKYTGKIKQVPPAYSAVHVKGRRLHELARKGVEVEAPERDVEVYEFKLLSWKPDPSPRGIFRLRVGRGTYVRALARDLGKDLGCGAAVSYLLRSRVGGFTLKNAVPLAAMRRMQRSTRPHPSRPTSEYAPRIAGGLLSDPATVLSGFPCSSQARLTCFSGSRQAAQTLGFHRPWKGRSGCGKLPQHRATQGVLCHVSGCQFGTQRGRLRPVCGTGRGQHPRQLM